jgi:hypothetical protein
MIGSKGIMNALMTVAVRGQGCLRGAVRVCLELFCSTFFFQEKKVEKTECT